MTAKQQRPAPKIVARLAEAVAARVAARATGPDSVQSMRRITYLAFVTGATTDQVIEKAGALAATRRGPARPGWAFSFGHSEWGQQPGPGPGPGPQAAARARWLPEAPGWPQVKRNYIGYRVMP